MWLGTYGTSFQHHDQLVARGGAQLDHAGAGAERESDDDHRRGHGAQPDGRWRSRAGGGNGPMLR